MSAFRWFTGGVAAAGLLFALGMSAAAEVLYLASPTALYSHETSTGVTTSFAAALPGDVTGWPAPRPVRLSADGTLVCTADRAAIPCYDGTTKSLKVSVASNGVGPYGWDVTPDGKSLLVPDSVVDPVSGGTVRGIRLIDVASGQAAGSFAQDAYAVAVSPDGANVTFLAIDPAQGSLLLQGKLPFALFVYDLATQTLQKKMPLRDTANAVVAGPWSVYGLADAGTYETGVRYVVWNGDAAVSVRMFSDEGVQRRQVAIPSVNVVSLSVDGRHVYAVAGSKAYKIDRAFGVINVDVSDVLATSVAESYSRKFYVVGGSRTAGDTSLFTYLIEPNGPSQLRPLGNPAITTVAAARRLAVPPTPVPQNGWWYASSRSGTGYSIEFKGNRGYIGTFTYTSDGPATWFVTACTLDAAGVCNGVLDEFRNGITLNGPFTQATPVLPSVAPVRLEFTRADKAVLSWWGSTVEIERFPIDPAVGITAAPAWIPENGWWWSTEESGRGWFIESQGTFVQGGTTYTNMFMVGYMYRDTGYPVWYTTHGYYSQLSTFGGAVPYFQGALTEFAGGPPIQGAAQGLSIAGMRGNVTVQFPSRTTATLTLPNGRNIALSRFPVQ